jgi:hypothetical protein
MRFRTPLTDVASFASSGAVDTRGMSLNVPGLPDSVLSDAHKIRAG